MKRSFPLVAVLFLALAGASRAAADTPAILHVPTLAASPSITDSSGWAEATHLTIGWDFTNRRPAAEPTDVAVAADGQALYVRFSVHQREGITSTQSVDNVGENSDDYVTVRLWPSGVAGLVYDFRANPRGIHYQASSENVNFAPAWTSVAKPTADGYTVTMRIPLTTMRSDGRGAWLAQFERDVKIGNERDEWAHGDGQTTSDQATYAGTIDGMQVLARAARTKPRAGVYALAQAGAPSAGGSTTRVGADIALPITPTTSLVAAIHPDFSTVETDQQTIAPTTFTRFFNEVRPFFAQGANFYDTRGCFGCFAGWSELYTPAIPTPRDGYQIEGKNGPFTFGALDAVGVRRIDDAQSFTWNSPRNIVTLSYTRVASEQTGLHDVVNFGSLQYNSQHGLVGYMEAGQEAGTNVNLPAHAQRWDAGIGYQTKDDNYNFAMRSIGPQWNPVDGFTGVNDVAGYSTVLSHTFHLHGALSTINLLELEDKYNGTDGFGTNVRDTESQVTMTFANNIQVQGNLGVDYYRVPFDPTIHPSNLQGYRFDYRINTPQQSTYQFQAGRYGDGWLIAIDRIAGIRLARRATLTLEGYSTVWSGNGTSNTQWLDRAAVIFDIDHATSFSVGLRKLIGTAPPFPGLPLPAFTNASNVSFSFARRRPHDDLFLVYGDPNTLSTTPALILKYVHYFGADRGA